MTTFVFVMSRSATNAQQTRMMAELEERFPHHDFLMGDAHFAEYERNILALAADDGDLDLDPVEIGRVIDFFQETLSAVESWKPS